MIEIIDYQDKYQDFFKELNLEWIQKYFKVEPADEYVLTKPVSAILDKGGFIFFAKSGSEIVGTCALQKVDDKTYELAKMAVNEKFQGFGIGRMLMEKAIQKAKELQLEKLELYTNSKLTRAIDIYQKYGFQVVPLYGHPTKRANIKMEITLTPRIRKVNIQKKLNLISDYWKPRIVGELNNQQVRIVKIKGEFVFHTHENEDEFFLVVKGILKMEYESYSVELQAGEFIIVPRGVKHRPVAVEEVHLLLFEPATILNTGNVKNDLTLENPERI
jgi:mannose-6-phosphate isomerase-like protein (cupin superfamily)